MTSKERMLAAMRNQQPDCVPVAPDMSNMIPCRLTGKPFWDIYLYKDPPRWKAYIQAAKHFGIDGWLDGVPVLFEGQEPPSGREAIVHRTDERIYTRRRRDDGTWSNRCNVYYIADPPTGGVPLEKVGLPTEPPTEWEDVEPRTRVEGVEAFHEAMELMGDDGVVALSIWLPGLGKTPEATYEYYDHHDRVVARCEAQRQEVLARLERILALGPDFVLIGMSGHMIWNPEPIFRELSLPTLKDATAMCRVAGIPSQIHCCGPEYDLVRMAATETDLSSINPLEIPPMGDCHLAEVKREFGDRIGLMGNLHTTEVMLRGSADDVRRAAREAIDAAAEGGGFILSTGDQCGRDTPDANILAMVETARTYGRY